MVGGGAALVPKLRFSEFRDAAEWQKKSLSSFLTPIARDRKKPSEGYKGLGLRSHGKGTFLKEQEDPEKNSMETLYEVKRDDLIVSITFAWEGAIAIAGSSDDGALVSHRFPTYIFSKDRTLPEFFKFKIVDKQFVYKLGVISPGGAGRNRVMNKADFLKLKVFLPKLDEQQKIADCLDSVDALIAAQGRKVEALKAHKKGLMQQLFPQEGETQPRLRFPEFEGVGEWELKRVDERGIVLAGKALAAGAPGPLRPYLRTKNVLDGAIDLSDMLTMPMTEAEFSRFEILDGDVLLNEGQSLELVGRTAIYRGEFRGRCAIQNQLLRFRSYPATYPEFAAQAFRKYQKDGTFAKIATKTTSIAHLGSSRFSSLRVAWPALLAEQQRIADCLNSLDDLIATETRKVNAFKIHKKGLMQQLFPQVGEADA